MYFKVELATKADNTYGLSGFFAPETESDRDTIAEIIRGIADYAENFPELKSNTRAETSTGRYYINAISMDGFKGVLMVLKNAGIDVRVEHDSDTQYVPETAKPLIDSILHSMNF